MRKELETKDGATKRMMINEEYVEGLDKSDGSKPYDFDVEEAEVNQLPL